MKKILFRVPYKSVNMFSLMFLSLFLTGVLINNVVFAGGAYTHIYIAHSALEKIENSPQENGIYFVEIRPNPPKPENNENGTVKELPPPGKVVEIPVATVKFLREHQKNFLAGSIAPDYFPDVLYGITVSHQPCLQNSTCQDFILTLANSSENHSPEEIAYLFGYFNHVCTDVFTHHWVGEESGGDFEKWIKINSDSPDYYKMVRLHLGIEMLWDQELRNHKQKDTDFTIDIPYIRNTTLTPGSPVFEKYYNDKSTATTTYILGKIINLAKWHEEQETKAKNLYKKIEDKTLKLPCLTCAGKLVYDKINKIPCPNCDIAGKVSETIKKNCPKCKGTKKISKTIQQNCPTPGCRNGYIPGPRIPGPRIPAPTLRNPIRTRSGPSIPGPRLPCPHCSATGLVSKVIEETCPCKTGKVSEVIQKTCPKCNASKLVDEILKNTPCPTCPPAKTALKRLENYHRIRKEAAYKLVDDYIETHRQLAIKFASDGKLKEVKEAYDIFSANLTVYLRDELTAIDLIAPEFKALHAQIKVIFEDFETAIKDQILLYNEITELKEKIADAIAEEIGNIAMSMVLSDAEEAKYRNMLKESGSLDKFGPLVDSVNLFIMALDGVEPTLAGLNTATDILTDPEGTWKDSVNNIDSRCQYKKTLPYKDQLSWNECFNQKWTPLKEE